MVLVREIQQLPLSSLKLKVRHCMLVFINLHSFVGSVTVSLSNVQAMRIGDTIVLSWDPVTLEEAKGFFVYSIRLTPDDDSTSSTLRQTNTRTISVAYDTTSVNITDTEPQLAYTVSISVLLLSDVGLTEGPAVDTYLTS